MPKNIMIVNSLKELLNLKPVKRILHARLTNKYRRCFVNTLETYDRLASSGILVNLFHSLSTARCFECNSKNVCMTMILALTEFKATMEGQIEEMLPIIEDGINNFLD